MALLKVICWAIIFITRLRFPPGKSLATILNKQSESIKKQSKPGALLNVALKPNDKTHFSLAIIDTCKRCVDVSFPKTVINSITKGIHQVIESHTVLFTA